MRTLKFRGWDGESMQYGGFSIHATAGKVEPFRGLSRMTESSPVMQFTGLTDKEGKDIYEGDILNLKDEEINVIVTWSENDCMFELPIKNDNTLYCSKSVIYLEKAEIIGNIYQNKDLLGQIDHD